MIKSARPINLFPATIALERELSSAIHRVQPRRPLTSGRDDVDHPLPSMFTRENEWLPHPLGYGEPFPVIKWYESYPSLICNDEDDNEQERHRPMKKRKMTDRNCYAESQRQRQQHNLIRSMSFPSRLFLLGADSSCLPPSFDSTPLELEQIGMLPLVDGTDQHVQIVA